MAVVIVIFLAESMLFSFELRLARVSFFLPPTYSLGGSAFGAYCLGGGAAEF